MSPRTWTDVTAELIDVLNTNVDTFPTVPNPRPDEFVVVRRTGGGSDMFLDRAQMDIEVWSGGPRDSIVAVHTLAGQVREWLRTAPDAASGLCHVVIDTLGFLADEVTGSPRIIITATVTAKPTARVL